MAAVVTPQPSDGHGHIRYPAFNEAIQTVQFLAWFQCGSKRNSAVCGGSRRESHTHLQPVHEPRGLTRA